MRFEQEVAAIDIGRHLVLVPAAHRLLAGHQRDDRAGDVERDAGAGTVDPTRREDPARCHRARGDHHAFARADEMFAPVGQHDLDPGRTALVPVQRRFPADRGDGGVGEDVGAAPARIEQEGLCHPLFATIRATGVAIAAIGARRAGTVGAVILAEPGRRRRLITGKARRRCMDSGKQVVTPARWGKRHRVQAPSVRNVTLSDAGIRICINAWQPHRWGLY